MSRAPKRCDYCGKAFAVIPSREDTARFCSRECYYENKRQPKVRLECEECGSEFTVKSRRKHTAKYCTMECRSKRYELECDHCGDLFEVHRSRADSAKYCSRQCSDLARRRREKKVCEQCGESFVVHLSQNDQRFCSVDCRAEVIVGEKHPRWDDGVSRIYYGPSWDRQREMALNRDGYRCKVCGMAEEAHIELVGGGLHVHHIQPFRTFDSHRVANSIDNLMSVCRSCHLQIEPLSQALGQAVGAGA